MEKKCKCQKISELIEDKQALKRLKKSAEKEKQNAFDQTIKMIDFKIILLKGGVKL